MNIDRFFFRIILLLIPGIIGSRIFRKLKHSSRADKKYDSWIDFFEILVFAVFSSLLYDCFILLINSIFDIEEALTFTVFTKDDSYFSLMQYIGLLATSLVLALLSCYACNRRLVYRIAKKIKLTNRYGDEDVWERFNNTNKSDWVYIRDNKQKLTYFGNIHTFSETDEKRELIIDDVSVYDEKSEHLYDVDRLYIERDDCDLTIEVPKANKGEKNERT